MSADHPEPEGAEHDPRGPKPTGEGTDPILRRRARLLRLTAIGQRIGYSCFALATVLLIIALATQLPSWLVSVIVVLMVLGCIVLPPAIIISYGAKAADKEDRGEPFGY